MALGVVVFILIGLLVFALATGKAGVVFFILISWLGFVCVVAAIGYIGINYRLAVEKCNREKTRLGKLHHSAYCVILALLALGAYLLCKGVALCI